MPRIPNPSFVFPASAANKDKPLPPIPPRNPARKRPASSSISPRQDRSRSSLSHHGSMRPEASFTIDMPSTCSLDSPVESSDIPPCLQCSWHITPDLATVCSRADAQHLCLLAVRHQIRQSASSNFSHRSSIRSDLEARFASSRECHSYCDSLDLRDELLDHPSLIMDDESIPLVSNTQPNITLPSLAIDTPSLRRTRRSSKLNYFHRKKSSVVIEPDLDTIPESRIDKSRIVDTRRHCTVFEVSDKNILALQHRDETLDRLEGRITEPCNLGAAPRSLSQLKGYFARQNLTIDTQAVPQKSGSSPILPIDSAYHSAGPSQASKGSLTTLVNSSGVPSAVPSSNDARYWPAVSVSSIKTTSNEWLVHNVRDTDVQMAEKAGAACQQNRQPSRNALINRSAADGRRRLKREESDRKKQDRDAYFATAEENQSGIRKLLSRLMGKHVLKKQTPKRTR